MGRTVKEFEKLFDEVMMSVERGEVRAVAEALTTVYAKTLACFTEEEMLAALVLLVEKERYARTRSRAIMKAIRAVGGDELLDQVVEDAMDQAKRGGQVSG